MCLQMPSMSQCSMWESLCQEVPMWPICQTGTSNDESMVVPIMRMYFHTGIVEYVLFQGWVPTNAASYAGTWLTVFFLAFLLEASRYHRLILERRWMRALKAKKKISNEEMTKTCHEEGTIVEEVDEMVIQFDPKVDISRALVHFIEVALSFFLMLIAMTFNVGLFFAICTGAATGMLLFGRYIVLLSLSQVGKPHH